MKYFSSSLRTMLFLGLAAGLYAQSVTIDQTSLNFSGQSSGVTQSATINIGSTGVPVAFFVTPGSGCYATPSSPWLTTQPTNGTTPAAVRVTADPSALQPNVYQNCVLTISGGSGNGQSVTVTFTVSAIGASPSSLAFPYTIGGVLPAPQSITLAGPGVTFGAAASITTGGNWLQVSPLNGTAPGTVSAQVNSAIVPALSAGTYHGAITISPSSGPPIVIPVTLTVTPAPPITLSATSLPLVYQVNGANNNASQTLTIATTGSSIVSYGITASADPNPAGANWILSNPSTGQVPANGSVPVSVSYAGATNLPARSAPYTGSVTVTVSGGVFPDGTTQQTIPVSLLVSTQPLLVIPGNTLNFVYEIDGAAPAAQNVTPCTTAVACDAATGQSAVTVAASAANNGDWLAVNPTSGLTGAAYAVSVAPTNLAAGTYNGTITVTLPGAGNSPQTVPVVLTVAHDPLLRTSTGSLSIPFQLGQSAPAPQTIAVTTSTGAPLNYTAAASTTTAANCPSGWLNVGGTAAGPTPGSFTASVNTAGLGVGTCTGAIAVTATDPATGAAGVNSISIPVTLTVSANPLLTVTLPGTPAAPPFFTAQQSGSAPPAQMIVLGSTDPNTTLSYSITLGNGTGTNCGGNWLFVSPQSGTTAAGSNTITLLAQPGNLSAGGGCGTAGVYTGSITIAATNPGSQPVDNATIGNPIVIPVTLQVTAGTITLDHNTLAFAQAPGGSAPAAQTVNVTSTGAALHYSVAVNSNSTVHWLSAQAASGTTPDTVSVSVDATGLTSGNYVGTVILTASNGGGSPATITVNLTVTSGVVSVTPSNLNFTQTAGGPAPLAQTLAVGGTTGLNFSVSTSVTQPAGGSWLAATVGTSASISGTTPANVQVIVSAGALPPGTYTGAVVVASPGASGSPVSIPVTLTVVAPVTLAVTPANLVFSYVLGTPTPAAQSVQLTSSAAAPFTAAATTSDGGKWLVVAPSSGNAGTSALPVSISINPAALSGAGSYTGTVTFSASSGLAMATVGVSLSVASIPAPVITGIQNDASYTTGSVAPGENIVIYGAGVGPAQMAFLLLTPGGSVATAVAGTQVFFDSNPAPIIYTSAGQTSVMVPQEVAGRTTTQITVIYQGVSSVPLTYNVVVAAPGLYTQNAVGNGPGSILNQDYSVNGPTKPAAKGSYIQVYLTGSGSTAPAMVTGAVSPADGSGLKNSLLTYTATIAGIDAPVAYQGTAPGLVEGVMQFNIQVPANAPSGAQPIVISAPASAAGGAAYSTQAGVTVQVQ